MSVFYYRNRSVDPAARRWPLTKLLGDLIIEAVKQKEAGHQINAVNFVKPKRNMSMIGG